MTPVTTSDANVQEAVPFFGISSMDASLRFYRDGLGFEMTHHWIDDGKLRWCALRRGGASLMLQEYRTDGAHEWKPAGTLGAGVSICFFCKDAVALWREFIGRGIDASRPFVGNGLWVTSLRDPDGYRIDFESYTDVPEGTELEE